VTKGAGSGGSFSGTIDNNTIGTNGAANSGSSSGGGISVTHLQNGISSVAITNNGVFGTASTPITALVTNATNGSGKLSATVQGNTVATVGSSAPAGIYMEGGLAVSDQHRACFTVGGAGGLANSVNLFGTTTTDGIRVYQLGATLVFAGGPTTAAGVQALVGSTNTITNVGGGALAARSVGSFQASCPP
jgi:hypothetical protein